MTLPVLLTAIAVFAITPYFASAASAQSLKGRAVVPGTGSFIDYVGDDFEGENWNFVHRHPKSSREQDDRLRSPRGKSQNGRWSEGPERGQPDTIRIIDTPPGGPIGSKKALLLQTLHSGIPGYNTRDVQQDDLIAEIVPRLRGGIPVSETPSFVVRIFLPEFDRWENRSGPHFGIRGSCTAMVSEQKTFLFSSRTSTTQEPYWPGMWIHFRSESGKKFNEDSAYIAIRGDKMGRDYRAKEIDRTGWWTFGMTFTPDGSVHYYAKPGLDDLTAADHLDSQYPYSYQARQFRSFFFDVCNFNNGQSWSTPFVIDDAELYVVRANRINSIVASKKRSAAKRMAQRQRMQQKRMAAQQRSQTKRR
ncbi:hypothetical protein OAS39_08675 [Pirellulales bacterium]|nr:hypothetical protein [Pirellulales bacterium]